MEADSRTLVPGSVRPRRAGPERAGEIAALHRSLFDPSWDAVAVARLLSQPASLALVVEADGAIAGFVLAQIAADQADILSLGVAASWQRAGLGSRLVTELGCALKASGVRKLYLEVASDNTAAFACYQTLGFTQVGVRRRYYTRTPNAFADAVVLVRDL